MKRVVIHIDRLVLNGFRHEDRHAIAAGLQERLARALGDREALASLSTAGDMSRLQVGNVHIRHGTNPHRIGASVAIGIGKGLQR